MGTSVNTISSIQHKGLTAKILKTAQDHPDLSSREIATLMDCSHVNVYKTLQRYGVDTQRLSGYKQHRADIYADRQRRIIDIKLTDDAIKKMPDNIAPLWFNSLYNNERIERGQATEIVEYRSIHADIAEIIGKIKDMPINSIGCNDNG